MTSKFNAFIRAHPKTRIVKFFASEPQFEVILTNARLSRFDCLAAYLRHLALDYQPKLEKGITENNKLIKNLIHELRKGDVVDR